MAPLNFLGSSFKRAPPPGLVLVFEDIKTADECASAMKQILNKALGISGRT
jgi:hypothetical protein